MYDVWLRVRARYLVVFCMLTFVSLIAGFLYYLSFPNTGLEVSYDRVGRVDANGPAARAGIRPGDQILSINGKPFFARGEPFFAPGDRSAFYVLIRDGQQLEVTVNFDAFSMEAFAQKFGHYFIGFGLWLIGACILFLRARDPRADLLIICCFLAALIMAVLPFADLGIDWANRLVIVLLLVVSPAFVQYHAVFPERKLLAGKQRIVLGSLYATSVVLCLARVPFPTLMLAESGWLFPINVLMRVFLLFCMGLGLALLAHTYRSTASILVKRQAGIMLFGTGISVVLVSLLVVAPQIVGAIYPIPTYFVFLLLLLIPLSYAYATYRHRLMSIDRKVNRTVVFATLALVLVGLYAFMEAVASKVLMNIMPVLDSTAANWIAMGMVALTIIPLKERTQKLVDTAFYGGWYSYRSIIQKIAHNLNRVKDFESLTSQLVEGLAGDLRIQSVALLLPDGEGDLHVEKSVGFESSIFDAPIRRDSPLVQYLMQNGGPIEHLQLQSALNGRNGASLVPKLPVWRDARLWVPLIRDDELEGILVLGLKEVEDFFDGEDLVILKTLAQQAAISVQNLRLIKMLRQQLGETEALYREVMRAREEEQRRLARDLHDSVLQEIATLSHKLEQFAEDEGKHPLLIESTQDTLRQIDRDLRKVCQDIQQAIVVSDIGLAAALQQQMSRLADDSTLQVELHLSPEPEIKRIPRDVQNCLYRVSQELLRNVLDHSRAGRVHVSLLVSDKRACLEVRDDGIGFTVPSSLTQFVDNNHFGLAGLQQRVMSLGGNIKIESAIQQGTNVQTSVPIALPSSADLGP